MQSTPAKHQHKNPSFCEKSIAITKKSSPTRITKHCTVLRILWDHDLRSEPQSLVIYISKSIIVYIPLLEISVVPKEERRKNERLAWARWWLVANERLITNKSLTNTTRQTSAGRIFQHPYVGNIRRNVLWWDIEHLSIALNRSVETWPRKSY